MSRVQKQLLASQAPRVWLCSGVCTLLCRASGDKWKSGTGPGACSSFEDANSCGLDFLSMRTVHISRTRSRPMRMHALMLMHTYSQAHSHARTGCARATAAHHQGAPGAQSWLRGGKQRRLEVAAHCQGAELALDRPLLTSPLQACLADSSMWCWTWMPHIQQTGAALLRG